MGYEVIGTTRLEKYNKKNHKKLGIDGKFPVKTIDYMNIDQIINFLKDHQPDEIYNLSGQSSVSDSFKNPTETFNSISLVTLNILEASRKIKFEGSIFFAGSSEMFGNIETPGTECTVLNPSNPYAIAKANSFHLVKFYRKVYGLNAVTGILYNHESSLREERFVTNKIIRAAYESKKNNQYTIKFGNLNIARDWGWAEDYVEAMHLMIHRKNQFKDHVICTGQVTKLTDFIDKVFKKFNLDWKNHIISSEEHVRKTDISISYGNPQKIFQDLQWKSKLNIDDIISKLLKNYNDRN
jgi:GDPmannose 4,6-dehydratase